MNPLMWMTFSSFFPVKQLVKSREGDMGRGMWEGRLGEMEGYLEGEHLGFFSLTETEVLAVMGGRLDSKIQEKT